MIQRLFWRLAQLSFDLNRRYVGRPRPLARSHSLLLSRAAVASYTVPKRPLFGIALLYILRKKKPKRNRGFTFSPPRTPRKEGESEKLTQKISISQTSYSIFTVLPYILLVLLRATFCATGWARTVFRGGYLRSLCIFLDARSISRTMRILLGRP